MNVVKPSVEIYPITSIDHIEKCARVCYKSEDRTTDRSARRMVKNLLNRGHEAMLEFGVIAAHFVADRGFTHELVRHRPASYAQESTRYCNYTNERFSGEISVIEPPRLDPMQRAMWLKAARSAELSYILMVDAGCRAEIARAVLPTCLKSEIWVQANFREWRHIFKLRCAEEAHPLMRKLMREALLSISSQVSVVFDDLATLYTYDPESWDGCPDEKEKK